MTDVQIVMRRWQDVDDRTVVRWNGVWREVLQVYRNQAELDGEWAGQDGKIDAKIKVRKWGEHNNERLLTELAAAAFDRMGDDYVLARLFDHRNSRDEVQDWWQIIYRLELVECQSLPAYPSREPEPERRIQSLSPAAEVEELDRHPGLVAEYRALRATIDAQTMTVSGISGYRFVDGVLTHCTIEYASDNGQFRVRLQELDEHGAPKP